MHSLLRVVAPTLVVVASTVAAGCRPSESKTADAPAPLPVCDARPLRPLNIAAPAYYTEPAASPTGRIVGIRTEDFGESQSVVRQPGQVANVPTMANAYAPPSLPESRVPAQFASRPAPAETAPDASRQSKFIVPNEAEASLEATPDTADDVPYGTVTVITDDAEPNSPSSPKLPPIEPQAQSPVPPGVASAPSGMPSVLARRPAEPPAAAQPTPLPAPRRAIAPSALDAVNQQANQRIDGAFSLARRGAMFAARAELIQSLRMVAQALDTLEGSSDHSRALAEGLQAIEEAEDFHVSTTQLKNDLQLSEVVAGHETPVLKEAPLDQVSSLVALQRYFGFAQQRLTLAAGGTSAGSRALYGLGKVHMSLAGNSHDDRSHELPKAIVYHQSALAADASNYLAANEVGVLLAQFGQLEAAKSVLLHSVQVHPHVEGWQNLAVVHSRLGENDLARLARQEQDLLIAQQETRSAAPQQMVEWVSPQTFVARGLPDDETRSIAAARSAANQVPAGASSAVRR